MSGEDGERFGDGEAERRNTVETNRDRPSGVAIHGRGYWVGETGGAWYLDEPLAGALAELFAGRSVVDLGCGRGEYVTYLRKRGMDCDGFDGNPFVAHQSGGTCRCADLSVECELGVRDWVLSLEVGEHVPPEFERTFVKNLHRHNREGIVLSWAIPGQGGHGHVNERTNDDVRALVEPLGYRFDPTTTGRLRVVSKLPWFANTLLVFRRESPPAWIP